MALSESHIYPVCIYHIYVVKQLLYFTFSEIVLQISTGVFASYCSIKYMYTLFNQIAMLCINCWHFHCWTVTMCKIHCMLIECTYLHLHSLVTFNDIIVMNALFCFKTHIVVKGLDRLDNSRYKLDISP